MTKTKHDIHRRANNVLNIITSLTAKNEHAQAIRILESLIETEYVKGFKDGQKRRQGN